MKNYVSFNAKYYKNSNASGEIGHIQRVFAENTNAIKHLTKNNFGCNFNIYDKYKEIYKKVEEVKNKKIQENSNTFMDGVLSFSQDQMLEIMKKPDWKKTFSLYIENFMDDVKQKTGMEPVGWEMHMDEGTEQEDGSYSMNYHAQLIFFNFDFKTKKAPLRDLMGRKGDSIWSKLQDVAGQRFEPLGFQRGVSAEMTKAKHKEKDQFINEKQKKLEKRIEDLEEVLEDQTMLLEKQQKLVGKIVENAGKTLEAYNEAVQFINDTADRQEKFDGVKSSIKFYIDRYKNHDKFKKFIDNTIGAVKKALSPDVFQEIEKTAKSIINYFSLDFKKLDNKKEMLLENPKEAFEILKNQYDNNNLVLKNKVEETKRKKEKFKI